VESADEARLAVSGCKYPPLGKRSYGPTRAALRIPVDPPSANESVACIPIIESAAAVANIKEICAVEGVDAVLVGPLDLAIDLGGTSVHDTAVAEALAESVAAVVAAAEGAGIASMIYAEDGASAVARLVEGFTAVCIGGDLAHLERTAAHHLTVARGG
jgi:4-hydroxy-2-oxoheptanedioate aldolase